MGDAEHSKKGAGADKLEHRLEPARENELGSDEKKGQEPPSQGAEPGSTLEPDDGLSGELEGSESLYSRLEKRSSPADEARTIVESSRPEVGFEPYKPAEEEKKSNLGSILVVTVILFALSFYLYATVFRPVPDDRTNIINVNGQEIAFRSLISDCKAVPVLPNASSVRDAVRDADKVILLFDPNKDARYALGVSESYKVLSFLKIKSSYAYSAPCNATVQNDAASCVPGVPVLAASDGTTKAVIVSLEQLNSTFVSSIAPGQIIVSGANASSYDSAVCAFDLSVLGVV